MLRMIALATFGFVLACAGAASAACSGADPALVSVKVASVGHGNGTNRYTFRGTVTNVGNAAQAGDVLQFVDIYQSPGEKLDATSIPPLAAGQSHTFSYVMLRSSEAGNKTTTLQFKLDVRQPSPASAADCGTGNDSFSITF